MDRQNCAWKRNNAAFLLLLCSVRMCEHKSIYSGNLEGGNDLFKGEEQEGRAGDRESSSLRSHDPTPVLIIRTLNASTALELKFYSRLPRSISHNILLQQTEAVVPPLSTRIMIRLKALTGETWTNARWWERFAAQSTPHEGEEERTIGYWRQQGGVTGAREKGLEASQPQKAAGDSTVPIVTFHYIPLSLFLPASVSPRLSDSPSNQVLPLSSSLSLKKKKRKKKRVVSTRPLFLLEMFAVRLPSHTLNVMLRSKTHRARWRRK